MRIQRIKVNRQVVRLVEIGVIKIVIYPNNHELYEKLTPTFKCFGYSFYKYIDMSQIHYNTCTKDISKCRNEGVDLVKYVDGSYRPE
jgi:hypothetical protein